MQLENSGDNMERMQSILDELDKLNNKVGPSVIVLRHT